jgi:hypothetical protein
MLDDCDDFDMSAFERSDDDEDVMDLPRQSMQTLSADSSPGTSLGTLKRNIPRRNLSVGDMERRASSSRKLRASLSDLTDETFISAEDSQSECDIKMPYSEIVTIAGVSDIPSLQGQDFDEMPPPPNSLRSRKVVVPKANPKAVVSLISPHKLLIVSKDFCDLFGYTVESEICGRAIKLLEGPRTDPSVLVSGIKNSALTSTASCSLVLYGRDGQDVEVEISFSPYLGDNHTLSGCLLEISLAASA